MQDLRARRLHARALASRKSDDVEVAHVRGREDGPPDYLSSRAPAGLPSVGVPVVTVVFEQLLELGKPPQRFEVGVVARLGADVRTDLHGFAQQIERAVRIAKPGPHS